MREVSLIQRSHREPIELRPYRLLIRRPNVEAVFGKRPEQLVTLFEAELMDYLCGDVDDVLAVTFAKAAGISVQ